MKEQEAVCKCYGEADPQLEGTWQCRFTQGEEPIGRKA